MNIQTIQMDKRIALIHQRDYHKRVLSHRAERKAALDKLGSDASKTLHKVRAQKTLLEKEDETLFHTYRALARGERLINVASVMPKAGLQEETTRLPALAIAQADWKKCYLHQIAGEIVFSRDRWISWSSKRQNFDVPSIHMHATLWPAELTNEAWRKTQQLPALPANAIVPLIPAHLQPDTLDGYAILWEPKWSHEAPEDPLLLKLVHGHMYSIVAQWDLTPLEQSILEGR